MSERPTCPDCGAALPPGSPRDLCPRCLLRAGLGSDSGGPSRDDQAPAAGDLRPPDRGALDTHAVADPGLMTLFAEALERHRPGRPGRIPGRRLCGRCRPPPPGRGAAGRPRRRRPVPGTRRHRRVRTRVSRNPGSDRDVRAGNASPAGTGDPGRHTGRHDRRGPGRPAGRRPRRVRRGPGHRRPVHAARSPRRGGDGHGLPGRADPTGQAAGGIEADQGRHGLARGAGPVRRRTPGAGLDGSPQHRPRLRRRHHRGRPALLRDGAGPGRPDHRVLRPASAPGAGPAGAVRGRLPGGPARPPEGDHPPRSEALQRPGHRGRRPAHPQGHRLRRRQGDRIPAHRAEPGRHRGDRRHADVHVAGAGRPVVDGHRHPHRRLRAGRDPLRAAGRLAAARREAVQARGDPGDAADGAGGRPAPAEHQGEHGRGPARASRPAATSSRRT